MVYDVPFGNVCFWENEFILDITIREKLKKEHESRKADKWLTLKTCSFLAVTKKRKRKEWRIRYVDFSKNLKKNFFILFMKKENECYYQFAVRVYWLFVSYNGISRFCSCRHTQLCNAYSTVCNRAYRLFVVHSYTFRPNFQVLIGLSSSSVTVAIKLLSQHFQYCNWHLILSS